MGNPHSAVAAQKATGKKGPLKWTCFFPYTDREGRPRIGKGRTFVIDGQDIDLFPTGVLCAMLGRGRQALYVWEEKFGFPPALYHLADDERKKRWYSRRQLLAILHLYNAYGQLKKTNYDKLHQFIAAVRHVFYSVDQPTEARHGG